MTVQFSVNRTPKMVLTFWGLLALCSTLQAQSQRLPEGPGKVTTQRICSGCHAAEIVMGKHLSKDGWEQVVSSMVEKGATGTDDEFNQIIDYLATNFPKASTSDKPAPGEPRTSSSR